MGWYGCQLPVIIQVISLICQLSVNFVVKCQLSVTKKIIELNVITQLSEFVSCHNIYGQMSFIQTLIKKFDHFTIDVFQCRAIIISV
jgi:hypothetical protein